MTTATLTNEEIVNGFTERIGKEQVLSKLIERVLKAGDASIYRLVPRVVVQPRDVNDIQSVLQYCRDEGLYLTFRAAGTSLSGQAVTDGVLVDVAHHWKQIRIRDDGKSVTVQPGVIGAHVNAFLAPHRAKIGPDPASIGACMMGGIAANNASGMCCGVQFNSYHTMAALKMVLADGFYLDTEEPGAAERLQRERPHIHDGLLAIRRKLMSNPGLVERVRRKYAVKNTCGYSMNAFVDFEQPLDILAHILIGSEGTLGFIADITLKTLPDQPFKATALVYFKELAHAGESIFPLGDAGAAVLEIMDRASMLSVADEMNYTFEVAGNCAALLIEFQEGTAEALDTRLASANQILQRWPLLRPISFTRDPVVQADYWHMRKGLFPSVGAMREMGTAVIIEDICVHPSRLAECIIDLQALFRRHDLDEAIIFGHAKDGNLHFVICNDFSLPDQVVRYSAMMDDLTQLIVTKYDGSLKAEHGTGRNIAPFVELEWGAEMYSLMHEVKQLLDPHNVLNPGVILNDDPRAHLKNLKVMPVVSPVVDKCIECGFCEPRCPSRDLTTTPRQRIVLAREMARLSSITDPGAREELEQIQEDYKYYGIDTCAGDGMCATSCPVKIDTGAMIKDMRNNLHSAVAHRRAVSAAQNFAWLARMARFGLLAANIAGPVSRGAARVGSSLLHKLSGGVIPQIPARIPFPHAAPRLPKTQTNEHLEKKQVVYYSSCLTRTMGSIPDENAPIGLAAAICAVLEECGYAVTIPKGITSTCCGQAFYSKGFYAAAREAAEHSLELLWEASNEGAYPVICDTSPCSGQLLAADKLLQGQALARWKKLKIYDFPTFMAREVLPTRADWPQVDRNVILHPTCTLIKINGLADLKKVATTFATRVTIPVLAECCGFAGDKGFNVPELTLSATAPESSEVIETRNRTEPGTCGTSYYSTCRTCEIGMTAGTGEVYQSIAYLCYEALSPQATRGNVSPGN